jgi:hypothetical protein
MATLLVSDTSVLVDLHRGGILPHIFELPFEIGAPDVLFERELKNWDGPALEPLGLRMLVLDGDGVALAQSYRAREARLSLPDAFALALAKTGGHILLAGDAALRAMAGAEQVECHGVLWVFDALEQNHVVESPELLAALTLIADHPRCRLPKAEIRLRLEKYRVR